MRLAAVLVTAILSAAPASAQGPPAPAAAMPASPSQDAPPSSAQPLRLPVSLDKIRKALTQTGRPVLKLDEQPVFRVEIVERQKIEALIKTLNFNSGPTVPGGLYGYEQQQRLFPAVNYPGMQPYAAFTPGEMMQVSATTLLQNYLTGKIMHGISNARNAKAQQSARDDVRRAIVDYCTAQPHGGAGIQICDNPPDIR